MYLDVAYNTPPNAVTLLTPTTFTLSSKLDQVPWSSVPSTCVS